jgi:hypothetical protein
MRRLEICRSGDEWYVKLEGTFVVGFIGREAEQRAREQFSQLTGLLNLHSDVSRISADDGVNRRPPGQTRESSTHKTPYDDKEHFRQ